MGLELWLVGLVMNCFFLGCIVKDDGNCGRVDVGSNPPPITGFLTKEGGFGLLLVNDEIKEVYFNYRLSETRGFAENRVFCWHASICITTSLSVCQIFEYLTINRGFDSTNLWRHMVWQIHDLTSNIRIFGFDRVKMPFTDNGFHQSIRWNLHKRN
jgi:hypothetical protein